MQVDVAAMLQHDACFTSLVSLECAVHSGLSGTAMSYHSHRADSGSCRRPSAPPWPSNLRHQSAAWPADRVNCHF